MLAGWAAAKRSVIIRVGKAGLFSIAGHEHAVDVVTEVERLA